MSSELIDGYGAPARHPLVRWLEGVEASLDDARTANAWRMTSAELQDVLPRITRAKAQLADVELRVLREADRRHVGDDVGATNTPAWWAHVTGQRVPAARGAAVLAERLDTGHERICMALSQGRVNTDQARVIVHAVEALPADLGPALLADAEAHLVGLADLDGESRLDPKALRIAGRKILEVIAPEIAEAEEARVLEAEERHAAATATLTMRPDGHRSMLGRFKIPVLHGEILARHLNAIAAPRHQHATGGSSTDEHGTRVAKPLRWGQALAEYLETRDAACDGSPKAGGIAATVVVTATLEQLLGGLVGSDRPAALDTGELISAAHAAGSPARPASCPPSSVPGRSPSTWAARAGSTTKPNGSR